ncbi:hypothetical protein PIB30_021712 [Stylosanthes scabra]|uniref:Uncharacterized protein n=1 Tax=Stylosanthes scabra TaxID=79078 RepID=A0ABU6R9A3_9FABA|nr:hypothetical protein [Stylosanthes scabra]
MTLRLVDSWPKIPKEVGPAPQSGPGFETERIPNPGDFPSSAGLEVAEAKLAESDAFEVLRLNLGSTPVHLGDSVQWVNQPMVHLVNRSTGLDQSTPISHRLTTGKCRSTAVNVFFLAPARHKKSNGYTRISRIRTTENSVGQSTNNYEEKY